MRLHAPLRALVVTFALLPIFLPSPAFPHIALAHRARGDSAAQSLQSAHRDGTRNPPARLASSVHSYPSRALGNAVLPPDVPPVPTKAQLFRQTAELSAFIHFGINTFTGNEWGTGSEDPRLFNPTAFNASQWMEVLRDAGFKMVVLTAKHHDGFCLWPSKVTNHSVASSDWRNGKGDVVREVADAAAQYGLRFGVYLSPWDRNSATYNSIPAYNAFYEAQLRELLTGYGPVYEVWMDMAKGKDETRPMKYDSATWMDIIHSLQPMAVSTGQEPEIRWAGNEKGRCGQPSWSTSLMGGNSTVAGDFDNGDFNGPNWLPPEADVSIRPQWFWHPTQLPKTPLRLLRIYFTTIGRNCMLLLNVPPNSSGLIHPTDVRALRGFSNLVRRVFSRPLQLDAASANASSVFGCPSDAADMNSVCPFSAARAVDSGGEMSFWAAGTDDKQAVLEVRVVGGGRRFDLVDVREEIGLGQRVISFEVHVLVGRLRPRWVVVVKGSTVGARQLKPMHKAVRAERVRLVITATRGPACISHFGLFHSGMARALYGI